MKNVNDMTGFQPINRGYNNVFRSGKLSLGLVVPLEAYPSSPVPDMSRQAKRILLAEQLGFSAVWLRDVPFNVPHSAMPVSFMILLFTSAGLLHKRKKLHWVLPVLCCRCATLPMLPKRRQVRMYSPAEG